MNNILNDKFNIETQVDVISQTGELIVPVSNNLTVNADADYERTRSNLYMLLNQGQDALAHALEVAKSSENPRAFEVVGKMMEQLANINHQLLDLSEKRAKLTEKTKAEPEKQITNNNAFFVGSTTELNKMLNNLTGN